MLEVMGVFVHVPDVGNIVLLEVGVDTLADADEPILVAAGNVEQLQLLDGRRRIGHEFRRRPRVRGRGKPAHPRKGVEVCQAEVERLPAAHGKPGQRAVLAIGLHGIVGLDKGNDVLEEIVLERRSPAPEAGAQTATPATARIRVGRGIAIGQDEDHGFELLVCDQIIENDIRHSLLGPFLLLIAADAVEQIEHGILLVLVVAGRGIDLHPALHPNRLRVVIHALEFAVFDAFARLVESIRRIRKHGFVVRVQGDGAAPQATATAPPALAAVGGGSRWRQSRLSFGGGLRTSQVANLAGELNLIARNFAGEHDAKVIALGVQQLDKRHRIAVHFSFLELSVAFLVRHLDTGLAGQGGAVLLEVEGVFLQAALGFEFSLPGAGHIGRGSGAGEGREGQNEDGDFHGFGWWVVTWFRY